MHKEIKTSKEPLQPHNIPEELWQHIAMDYFHLEGK